MGLFNRILGELLLKKKHKEALKALAYIIKDCKKVSSVYECREMRTVLIDYMEGKESDGIRKICADLMEYLADTCYHAEHLYHKPRHNGWNTKREFPNINDYVKLGGNEI